MLRIFQRKLEVFIRKNKRMANIYVVFQYIGYKRHPSIKNKLINLGSFKDKMEAVQARDNYIIENNLPHKLSTQY